MQHFYGKLRNFLFQLRLIFLTSILFTKMQVSKSYEFYRNVSNMLFVLRNLDAVLFDTSYNFFYSINKTKPASFLPDMHFLSCALITSPSSVSLFWTRIHRVEIRLRTGAHILEFSSCCITILLYL